MLKSMRKHARYFYVLFFIVILTFIFWGVGTVDKTGPAEIVAEVGKYKITTEDYWKKYDRVYRFYRDIYKDKFDEEMEKKMNLKESVLDSLVNEKVLLILAQDAGMTVSDQELQEAIVREPAFLKNGVFDKEVYLNRLKLNRISPEIFEGLKRQELLMTKITRFIELSVDVTDSDLQSVQAPGNEQVAKMLGQAILNDKQEKALKSYIEGYKKKIKVTLRKELIA